MVGKQMTDRQRKLKLETLQRALSLDYQGEQSNKRLFTF